MSATTDGASLPTLDECLRALDLHTRPLTNDLLFNAIADDIASSGSANAGESLLQLVWHQHGTLTGERSLAATNALELLARSAGLAATFAKQSAAQVFAGNEHAASSLRWLRLHLRIALDLLARSEVGP